MELPLLTLTSEPANNLRAQILARVRSDIIAGRTTPGTVLSVPSLSTELGVSTTPVREALLDLARDGLITPMRNRGFRVEAMTVAAMENLFDMRVLLESHALVTVARMRLTDTVELTRLADAVGEAVQAEDMTGYLTTDRAFHRALVERANNPLLTKMVMQLRDDMRLYGIDSTEGRKRQKLSVKEHYQMIELAKNANTAGIAKLITHHIVSWKPLFMTATMPQ
jgi:DNA-binding GntR family transcriptional regulator